MMGGVLSVDHRLAHERSRRGGYRRRPRLQGRRPEYLLCDLADFFNRLPIIEGARS